MIKSFVSWSDKHTFVREMVVAANNSHSGLPKKKRQMCTINSPLQRLLWDIHGHLGYAKEAVLSKFP